MKSDKLSLKDKYYYFKEKTYFFIKNIFLDDNDFKYFLKGLFMSIRLSIIFLILNTIYRIYILSELFK